MSYVFSKSTGDDGNTTFGGYVDPVEVVQNSRKVIYSIDDNIINVEDEMIEFFGIKETSGTSVWFNITEDGTENGNPIFEFLNECFFFPSAIRDSGDDDETPIVHVRRVENNRRVLVHIQRSNTGGLLLGGIYRGTVGNDLPCVVQLRISGIRNGS